jgi:hypothetical protein
LELREELRGDFRVGLCGKICGWTTRIHNKRKGTGMNLNAFTTNNIKVSNFMWNSVADSVWNSVLNSVEISVWGSVYNSVRDPVWNSVYDGLQEPIREERKKR